MKRLFLDTNVYNHIGEGDIGPLKQSIADRKIEILTTPQILAELAATFKKTKDRGIKLCKIYGDLISKNVLQPPPILIRTEIESVLGGPPSITYLKGENKAEFFARVEELKNGKPDLYTIRFIEKITGLKKQQLKSSKLGYSKIEPRVLKEPIKKYPSFKLFLKEGVRQGKRLIELERYVVADLGSNAHKAAKVIEKKLNKTPHLAIALRIVPALTYYYHVQKNKPKHGDLFDCGYFVCVANLDGFVSDDPQARDLFKLVCPSKECLSLSEFLDLPDI